MSRKNRKTRQATAHPAGTANACLQSHELQSSGLKAATGLRINPSVGLAAMGLDEYGLRSEKREITLDEVRQKFGPAMSLGGTKDVRMACDEQLSDTGAYSLLQHTLNMGNYPLTQFMGYGALQNLSQNGLVRACIETVADDMTRAWVELKRDGQQDDEERDAFKDELYTKIGLEPETAEEDTLLNDIMAEMERLGLQKVFHRAVELDGYEGGALIFIDTGATGPDLKMPLAINAKSKELASERPLRFVALDPINVFPGLYNSNNPLAQDYFVPKTWWVLGQEVHASRLLRICSNECPILLKPSYNFFGIPQAQILWDYVIHFNECRVAAQRMINKFSLTVMKTNMADILTQGAGTENLDRRIKFLVQNRSNDGVLVVDKESEDVVKLETPISGMTDIVKQGLEFLAAINRTPAVKLLGISPSGFNATGESDIRNYYDHIRSQQEKLLRPAVAKVLDIVQIKLRGEVDKTIAFDFAALSEEDEAAKVATQKTKADIAAIYLGNNVLSPEEVRKALAEDPDSGFNHIDVDDMPEPQEGPDMGDMGEMPAQDEEEWRTSKSGKHYEVETTTGEITKGNVGQPNKPSYEPLKSTAPDTEAYNSLLSKHEGDHVKAAKEYFKQNLQGRTVEASIEGQSVNVAFTGNGWGEIKKHMGSDPLKAEIVTHMPDIINSGEYEKNENYKPHGDIKKFHTFKKTVQTSQGAKAALVDVAERERNIPHHSAYNLNHEGTKSYAIREQEKAKDASLVAAGQVRRSNKAPSVDDNIAATAEVVNIRLAEEGE